MEPLANSGQPWLIMAAIDLHYMAKVYEHLTNTPISACWTSHSKPMTINMELLHFADMAACSLHVKAFHMILECLWEF